MSSNLPSPPTSSPPRSSLSSQILNWKAGLAEIEKAFHPSQTSMEVDEYFSDPNDVHLSKQPQSIIRVSEEDELQQTVRMNYNGKADNYEEDMDEDGYEPALPGHGAGGSDAEFLGNSDWFYEDAEGRTPRDNGDDNLEDGYVGGEIPSDEDKDISDGGDGNSSGNEVGDLEDGYVEGQISGDVDEDIPDGEDGNSSDDEEPASGQDTKDDSKDRIVTAYSGVEYDTEIRGRPKQFFFYAREQNPLSTHKYMENPNPKKPQARPLSSYHENAGKFVPFLTLLKLPRTETSTDKCKYIAVGVAIATYPKYSIPSAASVKKANGGTSTRIRFVGHKNLAAVVVRCVPTTQLKFRLAAWDIDGDVRGFADVDQTKVLFFSEYSTGIPPTVADQSAATSIPAKKSIWNRYVSNMLLPETERADFIPTTTKKPTYSGDVSSDRPRLQVPKNLQAFSMLMQEASKIALAADAPDIQSGQIGEDAGVLLEQIEKLMPQCASDNYSHSSMEQFFNYLLHEDDLDPETVDMDLFRKRNQDELEAYPVDTQPGELCLTKRVSRVIKGLYKVDLSPIQLMYLRSLLRKYKQFVEPSQKGFFFTLAARRLAKEGANIDVCDIVETVRIGSRTMLSDRREATVSNVPSVVPSAKAWVDVMRATRRKLELMRTGLENAYAAREKALGGHLPASSYHEVFDTYARQSDVDATRLLYVDTVRLALSDCQAVTQDNIREIQDLQDFLQRISSMFITEDVDSVDSHP